MTMPDDTTARDALQRSIACRLPQCSEVELRELDEQLTEIEKRRHIAEVGRQLAESESIARARGWL
jgi:hypothetical protein